MMKYGYDFYIIAGFLAGSILFGLLIGLYPASRPLLLLIGCYLLFAVVIPVKSNTRKSVYAFLLFTVLSIFTIPHRTILLGCIVMSAIVVHKHCLKANEAFRRGEEWRLE